MVSNVLVVIIVLVAIGGTSGYFLVFGTSNPIEVLGNVVITGEFEIPFAETRTLEEISDEFMDEFPDLVVDPTFPDISEEEFIEIQDEIKETEADFDNPITSDDDILTQIGDETGNENLPMSNRIGLLVELTKIDFSGSKFITEFRQELLPLAFFGEQETGIDFRNGKLEVRIFLESEPNRLLSGDGIFGLTANRVGMMIGDGTVSSLSVNGRTNTEGLIPMKFTSPTDETTDFFEFNFNDIEFPIDTRTIITGNVSELLIEKDMTDQFEIVNTEVFSFEVLNSPDALVFENEQGGSDVILPANSQLKITASTETIPIVCCGDLVVNSGSPRPAMGMVEVFDSQGRLIASHEEIPEGIFRNNRGSVTLSPSVVMINTNLARDSLYTIKIGEPTPIEFSIKTPLSQKNYDLSCFHDPTPLSPAELYTKYSYAQVTVANFPITCNFPLGEITVYPAPNPL